MKPKDKKEKSNNTTEYQINQINQINPEHQKITSQWLQCMSREQHDIEAGHHRGTGEL